MSSGNSASKHRVFTDFLWQGKATHTQKPNIIVLISEAKEIHGSYFYSLSCSEQISAIKQELPLLKIEVFS